MTFPLKYSVTATLFLVGVGSVACKTTSTRGSAAKSQGQSEDRLTVDGQIPYRANGPIASNIKGVPDTEKNVSSLDEASVEAAARASKFKPVLLSMADGTSVTDSENTARASGMALDSVIPQLGTCSVTAYFTELSFGNQWPTMPWENPPYANAFQIVAQALQAINDAKPEGGWDIQTFQLLSTHEFLTVGPRGAPTANMALEYNLQECGGLGLSPVSGWYFVGGNKYSDTRILKIWSPLNAAGEPNTPMVLPKTLFRRN